MSSYELLLFLHIAAAIIWLGAGATNDLLWWRAERSGTPGEMARMGEVQDWLTPRLFIPMSLATLLFGILLVLDSPLSFGDLWVTLGLLGFAAGFFTGLLYLKPQGEKMGAIVAEHGPASPQAAQHAKKLLVVARVQLLVLFLVVADMVLKPTGDDVGTLLVLGAVLAAAIAAAAVALRRPAGGEGVAAPGAH